MATLPSPKREETREAQSVFRDVNDRIRELASRWGADEPLDFVCECDDLDCVAPVALTVVEYDAAHSLPHRFVVRVDHRPAAGERLVATNGRYAVLHRPPGSAAAVAPDP